MITSLRMYSAVPRAAQAWRALFGCVFADACVDIRFVDHRWPQPIEELWHRADLCCDFMCGWPFARSSGAMQAIAAPVPAPPQYRGLPRYRSEFLVREASGWRSLEDTFGHRIGWMAMNSQSGFNAPRAHLAQFVTPDRPALYAHAHGPLGTPARTLEALRAAEVDVVALDTYVLDLYRHHAPEKLQGLRTVAETAWTPIPLLVAAPTIDERLVARLRARLIEIHSEPSYAPLLVEVLLTRFVAPDVASYGELESMARGAAQRGYDAIR